MLQNVVERARAIEQKDTRHVRTPSGARYYGLPIGAPITADAIARAEVRNAASTVSMAVPSSSSSPIRGTSNLFKAESDYEGYEKVVDGTGKAFYIEKDADYGDWVAYDAKDNEVAAEDTKPKLLKALDKIAKPRKKDSNPVWKKGDRVDLGRRGVGVVVRSSGDSITVKPDSGERPITVRKGSDQYRSLTAAKKKLTRKAPKKNGVSKPKAGAPRKKGDSYVRVGKGVDVRGENNWIDLSGGTPETMPRKVPTKGTRNIVRFEPGDKNYDKLRSIYVIPPMYETFWINADRDESAGDDTYDGMVFIGLDPNTGKRQQVMSTRHWLRQAKEVKFGSGGDDGDLTKVPELLKNRNRIIKQLTKDINSTDKKRRAAARALLVQALGGLRVGTPHKKGEKVADRRYGATTLEARHVTINKGSVTLSFMAKGNHQRFDANGDPILNSKGKNMWPGKPYRVNLRDKVLVDMFREELKSKSRNDRLFDVSATQANDYFRDVQKQLKLSGNLTTHNFRHAKATLLALQRIEKMRRPTNEKQFKQARRDVSEAVGAVINDTPQQAHDSYIMHSVWDEWMKGHPEWKDIKF